MASTRTTAAATRSPQAKPALPKWARTADAFTAHWLAAVAKDRHPYDFLNANALALTPRLLRLFAVACCRHPLIDSLLTDPRSRAAVDMAEKFADGQCGEAALRKAWNDAWAARMEKWRGATATAVNAATAATAARAAARATDAAADTDIAVRAAMREHQGGLLAALIGPGWAFSPAWATDTAVSMARHIYDNRDWGAMPILADAFEDAGCGASELLTLMRDPAAPWLRGARVLDELLGKRA